MEHASLTCFPVEVPSRIVSRPVDLAGLTDHVPATLASKNALARGNQTLDLRYRHTGAFVLLFARCVKHVLEPKIAEARFRVALTPNDSSPQIAEGVKELSLLRSHRDGSNSAFSSEVAWRDGPRHSVAALEHAELVSVSIPNKWKYVLRMNPVERASCIYVALGKACVRLQLESRNISI